MEFSWKIKLGLIVFGLALGLGAVELALELMPFAGKQVEYSSLDDLRRSMLSVDSKPEGSGSVPLAAIITPHLDDKIIYDLRPNLDVKFQRVGVKTNSCGMRDRERPLAKPINTYRIALLGDSFTFGWGVEQEKIFAGVLENELNRISTGTPEFEVLNFGIPGYSTFQEVSLFKERVLDFDPDAVVVFFVQNDFGMPFFVRDVARPGRLMNSLKFAQLASKAVNPELEAQQLELQGYGPNGALRELSDLTRARGIKLFVAINPRPDWRKDYEMLWILKERKDIELIRMRKSYSEIIKRHGLTHEDLTLSHDPHPSALRHKIMGKLMAIPFLEFVAPSEMKARPDQKIALTKPEPEAPTS